MLDVAMRLLVRLWTATDRTRQHQTNGSSEKKRIDLLVVGTTLVVVAVVSDDVAVFIIVERRKRPNKHDKRANRNDHNRPTGGLVLTLH